MDERRIVHARVADQDEGREAKRVQPAAKESAWHLTENHVSHLRLSGHSPAGWGGGVVGRVTFGPTRTRTHTTAHTYIHTDTYIW